MTGPLQARIQAANPPAPAAGDLTCQWCATALPVGETRCPSCGSSGVPDPSMQIPGAEAMVITPSPDEHPTPGSILPELDAWDSSEPLSRQPSGDLTLTTIAVLAGCGIVFAIIGAIIGPYFISPLIERITGAPVERAADVRPMGIIAGLIAGLFVGATWGWIAAPDK